MKPKDLTHNLRAFHAESVITLSGAWEQARQSGATEDAQRVAFDLCQHLGQLCRLAGSADPVQRLMAMPADYRLELARNALAFAKSINLLEMLNEWIEFEGDEQALYGDDLDAFEDVVMARDELSAVVDVVRYITQGLVTDNFDLVHDLAAVACLEHEADGYFLLHPDLAWRAAEPMRRLAESFPVPLRAYSHWWVADEATFREQAAAARAEVAEDFISEMLVEKELAVAVREKVVDRLRRAIAWLQRALAADGEDEVVLAAAAAQVLPFPTPREETFQLRCRAVDQSWFGEMSIPRRLRADGRLFFDVYGPDETPITEGEAELFGRAYAVENGRVELVAADLFEDCKNHPDDPPVLVLPDGTRVLGEWVEV